MAHKIWRAAVCLGFLVLLPLGACNGGEDSSGGSTGGAAGSDSGGGCTETYLGRYYCDFASECQDLPIIACYNDKAEANTCAKRPGTYAEGTCPLANVTAICTIPFNCGADCVVQGDNLKRYWKGTYALPVFENECTSANGKLEKL